jgi:hypothetical protein
LRPSVSNTVVSWTVSLGTSTNPISSEAVASCAQAQAGIEFDGAAPLRTLRKSKSSTVFTRLQKQNVDVERF